MSQKKDVHISELTCLIVRWNSNLFNWQYCNLIGVPQFWIHYKSDVELSPDYADSRREESHLRPA